MNNTMKKIKTLALLALLLMTTSLAKADGLAISMDDVTLEQGGKATVTVSVELPTDYKVRGAQFDIYLPEGLSFVEQYQDENGNSCYDPIVIGVSEGGIVQERKQGRYEIPAHSVTATYRSETNSLRCLFCDTSANSSYVVGDGDKGGKLCTFEIQADSVVAIGDYQIALTGIVFSRAGTDYDIAVYLDDITSKVTVVENSGIEGIIADKVNANSKFYNLQGMTVGSSTDKLPAGLYIRNGKKVIIK